MWLKGLCRNDKVQDLETDNPGIFGWADMVTRVLIWGGEGSMSHEMVDLCGVTSLGLGHLLANPSSAGQQLMVGVDKQRVPTGIAEAL